jgi:hypothetical protein
MRAYAVVFVEKWQNQIPVIFTMVLTHLPCATFQCDFVVVEITRVVLNGFGGFKVSTFRNPEKSGTRLIIQRGFGFLCFR